MVQNAIQVETSNDRHWLFFALKKINKQTAVYTFLKYYMSFSIDNDDS